MKIWSYTFGCKVNQYETELLRHRLTGPSDKAVNNLKEADLCLINTCSVTAFADKEARQMIRRVLRENSRARTIVTGCYATRAPKEVQAISSRIELYTNAEKDELPSCVGYEVADKPLGIHQFAGRTRAFLKIQDGCKAPCNYCIIPTVRPTLWSKPVEHVMAEAQALLANGYQELVLTGIRLGLYRGPVAASSPNVLVGDPEKQGKDWIPAFAGMTKKQSKLDLVELLEKMVALPQKFRIRLSSLEVTEVTDRLLQFVADNPKICRHFHIPMQSGDTEVLKSMQRWYDADFYKSRITAVRSFLPDCGLTADVMVGYPTESEQQFQNTFELIRGMEMSGLHVFRFSGREGTKAAGLKPLDPQTIIRRAGALGQLDKELRRQYYDQFEGQMREVLPEPSGEGWTDNYIRIEVPLADVSKGLHMAPVQSQNYSKELTHD